MSSFSEYPFTGIFYRLGAEDNIAPNERTEDIEQEIVATVECDVQEDKGGSMMRGGTLIYYYNVYFNNIQEVIKEGDMFSCEAYGRNVGGVVKYVIVNELGTKVNIEDTTT